MDARRNDRGNDTVAARFIMRGTHQATSFCVPASGKKILVRAVNFYRISSGKIVEERGQPERPFMTDYCATPCRRRPELTTSFSDRHAALRGSS
jgi:hypothetical protein